MRLIFYMPPHTGFFGLNWKTRYFRIFDTGKSTGLLISYFTHLDTKAHKKIEILYTSIVQSFSDDEKLFVFALAAQSKWYHIRWGDNN